MITSRLFYASARRGLKLSERRPIAARWFTKHSNALSYSASLIGRDHKTSPSQRFLSTQSTTTAESSKDQSDTSEPTGAETPRVEKLEFQAETRQLLDIVTHSLYTDKEVFLRELVSNASDSLEKLRHLHASNRVTPDGDDVPLEIRIELDEVTSSITITDTGVGMTKEELISNLGTIARSGSKDFLQEFSATKGAIDTSRGIIGKFGVGFYSSFMVGDKVEVRSRSALAPEQKAKIWRSDGSGSFEISDVAEGVRQERGSSVQIFLKESCWDFADETRIEKILKRYSNFINFPIFLNGKRVNTQTALWSMDPKEVSEEDYFAFYKYIANAVDDPLDTYHFRADAPIDVKALFFIPSFHSEKYGMERMNPGVSLYSRKVMIESKSSDILPEWLRFVKGVVDSEDLPLAISREKAQDTALIKKLRRTLTQKIIGHLTTMANKEKDRYDGEFYREYAYFLKEGVCQDYEFSTKIAKLLRFESTKGLISGEAKEDRYVSLDTYISRMEPEQKDIYYLVAPTRNSALASPYLEAFENAGVEVLLMYSTIDDFVMANLETYEGRSLVSVEKGDIDLSKFSTTRKETPKDDDGNLYKAERELTSQEILDFCKWFKATLGEEKVASCTATDRLTSSPAIVTDSESGAMRRMMYMVDTAERSRDGIPLPKQHVEINPRHSVVVGISDLIKTQPTLAKVLAAQVYDNCLVAAGLLDDSRSMLPRLNDILLCVVKGATQNDASSIPSTISKESSGEDEASEVVVDADRPSVDYEQNETIKEAEVINERTENEKM